LQASDADTASDRKDDQGTHVVRTPRVGTESRPLAARL